MDYTESLAGNFVFVAKTVNGNFLRTYFGTLEEAFTTFCAVLGECHYTNAVCGTPYSSLLEDGSDDAIETIKVEEVGVDRHHAFWNIIKGE